MRGVDFRIRISPRFQSQNRNGLKGSVRDLGQSDLCKNIGKPGSLPCPFKLIRKLVLNLTKYWYCLQKLQVPRHIMWKYLCESSRNPWTLSCSTGNPQCFHYVVYQRKATEGSTVAPAIVQPERNNIDRGMTLLEVRVLKENDDPVSIKYLLNVKLVGSSQGVGVIYCIVCHFSSKVFKRLFEQWNCCWHSATKARSILCTKNRREW